MRRAFLAVGLFVVSSTIGCVETPEDLTAPDITPAYAVTLPTGFHIDAGLAQTCATTSEGLGYCWGVDVFVSTSDGDSLWASIPRPVKIGARRFAQIDTRYLYTCALDTTGRVWCRNRNYEEFSLVETTQRFTSIAVGSGFGCGLSRLNRVFCWGNNIGGSVPYTDTYLEVPHRIRSQHSDFIAVGAGSGHACALRTGGELLCWGANQSGQLGRGSTGNRQRVPERATSLLFTEFSLGASFSCGRATDGLLYCWGANSNGELGRGTRTNFEANAAPVLGGKYFSSFSGGAFHTCGVSNTRAFCWGRNVSGQGGTGYDDFLERPTPVFAANGFVSITAGNEHSCAMRLDGSAACWGQAEGLGAGTWTDAPTPVEVVRPF